MAQWNQSLGDDDRRKVDRYMTGSGMSGSGGVWGIAVWPIDEDDVDGERQRLEELVDRVNAVAAPEQAQA